MSKPFWGGLVLFSVFLTGGAGTYLFTQLDRWAVPPPPPMIEQPAPVPLPPIQPKQAEPLKKDLPAQSAEQKNTEPEVDKNPSTRNILFRIPKPTAKSVAIVGDFNGWKRQNLEKVGKAWEVSIALEPGKYEYLYVIDGRRVKDPNNKNVRHKKSVITVKPIN